MQDIALQPTSLSCPTIGQRFAGIIRQNLYLCLMLRSIVFSLLFGFAYLGASAQLGLSPATINFSVRISGTVDSMNVTLTNNSSRTFEASEVDVFHGDAFWVTESSFSIPPSGSHSFYVYVNPRHNVRYFDYLLIKSPTHAEGLSSLLFTQGKYSNSYYDGTQNLWHEDLKTALKTLISFGTVDLGYTNARDQIFLNIDNKKNNGQGAAVNTMECIYTGTVAAGYINRQDCQTTFNFNTEHTYPQSLFGANPPMVSDMHHLFGVTSSSNSERGNSPFGVVSNPSWTNGGSKSNGSTFEPRDQQKGKSARAMFYFVMRYQNYMGFLTSQETVLRSWDASFPPDSVDVRRNDDIFALQNNRNPFSDHPFLERISSITGTALADSSPVVWALTDTMNFGDAFVNVPVYGQFMISNQGLRDLNLSNITFSDAAWSLAGNPSLSVPADSMRKLWVKFAPGTANSNFNGYMSIITDDPNNNSITVALLGSSLTVGVENSREDFAVFPNPVRERLYIQSPQSSGQVLEMQLFSLDGRSIRKMEVLENGSRIGLDVAELPRGVYLLRLDDGTRRTIKKIVLE